jgi:hypothetical protein
MDDGTVLKFSDIIRKSLEESERSGKDEYAKKFSLETLRCRNAQGDPFTIYICCTPEEREEIISNIGGKNVNLSKFKESGNIVSVKRGHDISPEEDQNVRNYYGYHFLRNKRMKETFPSEAIDKIVSEGKKTLNAGVRQEEAKEPFTQSIGVSPPKKPDQGFVR